MSTRIAVGVFYSFYKKFFFFFFFFLKKKKLFKGLGFYKLPFLWLYMYAL